MRRILLLAVIMAAWARPIEADLPGYDDAYYARKAFEVAESGEWLALPFNGAPTFDNPPLGIWAQALTFKLVGASDAAARLPTGLFGVLVILLAFEWGKNLFGERWTAFILAALILFNPLFLKYLRRSMLDVGLMFWSMAGIYLAQRKPLNRSIQAFSGVSFGLAYLTKSILGLAAPAALITGWWLAGTEGRRQLQGWWPPAVAGFLLVVGTWLSVMTIKFGSPFVNGHLVWLLWGEGVRGVSDSSRLETLARLAVLLLPVSAFFIATLLRLLRKRIGQGSEWRNLSVPWAWAWVPLVLLMAVGPRKLWYFLAVLPGVAAVAASGVADLTRSRPELRRSIVTGVAAIWCFLGLAIISLPIPLHRDRTEGIRAIAEEVRARTSPQTPISLFFPGESCRWDVRNAFIWYANRPVEGCSPTPSRKLPDPGPGRHWLLTSSDGLEQLRASKEPVLVWSRQGDLVLVSREPA